MSDNNSNMGAGGAEGYESQTVFHGGYETNDPNIHKVQTDTDDITK